MTDAEVIINYLLYVFVIVDVILAVAVETLAAGAVTEFQIGIGNVGATADNAFMGIGRFNGGGSRLVRAGSGEGNDLRLTFFAFLATEQPTGVGLPGKGNEI